MTTEEKDALVEEFLNLYGDTLPNPDHLPLQFNYLWKIFLYNKSLNLLESSEPK